MSPVAKSASTPLLEAMPASPPKVLKNGASQANSSSNTAETSFAQVQAQVQHQHNPAGGRTPRRGIPVTTTLTPATTRSKNEPPGTTRAAHVESTRSGSLRVTVVADVPSSTQALSTTPSVTSPAAGTPSSAIPVGTTLTPMIPQAKGDVAGSTGAPGTTSQEGRTTVPASSIADTSGARRPPNQPVVTTIDTGVVATDAAQPTRSNRGTDEAASQTGSTLSSPPSSSATASSLGLAPNVSGQTVAAQPNVDGVRSPKGATVRDEALLATTHGQAESNANAIKALESTGRSPSDASEQSFSQLLALRGAVGASSTSGGGGVRADTVVTPQTVLTTPLASGTSETIGSTPLGQLGTVVAQVVREGNLPRTITISLEPKELGQLQLQVTSNAGEIQVQIHVADPLTRGMVSAQLGDLTNVLNRDLGFGGQQTGNQGGHPEPGTPVQVRDAGPVQTEDALRVQPMPTALTTHSLIDLRL